MKKLFLTSALSLAAIFAFAQTPATQPAVPPASQPAPKPANPNAPKFKWSEETWDFGNIPQGTPVTHAFEFTNTGGEPLVISTCDKSCGCTTPKWTTEPVLPGQKGTVSATFNAAAGGQFTKTVTVHSNADGGDKVLYIKGNVIPKEEPKPAPAPTPVTPK